MGKVVDVGLAVIVRSGPQVLITRRPTGTVYAGYWELPGGKVDADESPEQAAVREAREELGVNVRITGKLQTVEHTYAHASVRLHPLFCEHVDGELQNLQVAEHRWVALDELADFTFPEANAPIIEQIVRELRRVDG